MLRGPFAFAQDTRPSEADIFGAPAEQEKQDEQKPEPAKPPAAEPAPADATDEAERDAAVLGDPDAATRLSESAAPADPLRLGGMFYLRALSSARSQETPNEWTFSAPALLDAYLDARPNERVRGLVLARMLFDPSLPPEGGTGGVANAPGANETMGTGDLTSFFARRTRGPRVALDQMWLRFDLAHTVFVTAGKQHARWGTGRFWAPTDYLHVRRRNPLDVFDARTGTTMLKLHAPWEATGWNFYAYTLFEDSEASPRLGDLAAAARAEIVLGDTELGAGALVKAGRKPKFGFDVSTGIWDLDVYAELALRYGSEIDRVRYDAAEADRVFGGEVTADAVTRIYPRTHRTGLKSQVVTGVSYSRRYNDNDVFNLGAEYFYNPLGYSSPEAYPGLILPRPTPLAEPATFFYLGRHYGAVFLNLPAPYRWDLTSFTLSTLGNISDQSFITRLDYSLTLLTHLRFEAFAAVRYGRTNGEFRFGVEDLTIGGQAFRVPPGWFDLGLGLRVEI